MFLLEVCFNFGVGGGIVGLRKFLYGDILLLFVLYMVKFLYVFKLEDWGWFEVKGLML